MKQAVQTGKPARVLSVREMFEQLAQREAEEIRRLRQRVSARSQK